MIEEQATDPFKPAWLEKIERAREQYNIGWEGELHIILSDVANLKFSDRFWIINHLKNTINKQP